MNNFIRQLQCFPVAPEVGVSSSSNIVVVRIESVVGFMVVGIVVVGVGVVVTVVVIGVVVMTSTPLHR